MIQSLEKERKKKVTDKQTRDKDWEYVRNVSDEGTR